jgi:hypothetical protein
VAVGATDAVVSSTRIRGLVGSGELEDAARLLGRDFELRGGVAPFAGGDGGALAFAVPDGMILPRAGRYEGSLQLGDGVPHGVEIEVPGVDGLRPPALLLHGAADAGSLGAAARRSPARLVFLRPLRTQAGNSA